MSGFRPERGSEAWEARLAQRSQLWRDNEERAAAAKAAAPKRQWYRRKRFIIPGGFAALMVYAMIHAPQEPGTGDGADWNRSISSAGLDTADQPMSFEDCNRQIRSMADELGTPSMIVDSSAMHTVRFSASDGSVLVTCDAIDEKMIVVKSPHSG